ncbi:restriction endonuclease subunit S [Lachnospiraceae bacterium AM23-7LB]|nr:restriction endonuclease subunit S [Lachnospiraceae bacterium AM23-7LB]RHV59120.1 restriction endonuclease subunit S [Lachnospiraceae bacterium OM02-26]
MIMAMKESGIEWVGLIPDDWKIAKNNRLFNISKQLVNGNWKNTQLLSLTKSGIIEKNINDGGGKQPESFGTYQYVEKDDIVLCLFDIDVSAVFSDRSKYDGMISPAYRVMKCTDAILPVYAKWWFDAVNIGRYYLIYTKSLRKTIDADGFGNILTVVPPLSEQQAIADYLDETCSQIDEIITEAKESIDEYKELKQSVIFEAVTKGLDKDIEMKNSEVEGMGFIPKKWSVVRFMKVNYVRARLGWKGLKAEEYVDVGYPFLAAYHIVNNHLCWESLNCITKERYDESPEIKLSIGDLVLVKDGAGIGKCARIDEMPLGEATVNSSLSVITPNKLLDYRYEYYYFMSPLFQNIIARLKNGMGVPHLTQESMKDIYLPLPSKKEQQAIADYLDNKVVELDSLITEKESLINDLEAYKKSRIYEVVTGKRRVV